MVKIIPAILTSNFNELKDLIQLCEGICNRVQIDIVDGVFADNKTIDPSVMESVETDLLLDYHLMVKEPKNWVERCVRGGADRIIGQVEMMTSQADFITKCQEVGRRVGLGIDLATSLQTLDSDVIKDVDVVLIMSVAAGRGGQEFDTGVMEKIKALNKLREGDTSPFSIVDDGGVTVAKINSLTKAGVDEVVIGRRIFEGDLKANIEKYTNG